MSTMFLSIYGCNTITTQNCNRRGSKTCILGAIFLGTLLVHWGGYFKNCPTFHSDENLMKDEFPDVLKRSNPNFVPAALCQQNGRKNKSFLPVSSILPQTLSDNWWCFWQPKAQNQGWRNAISEMAPYSRLIFANLRSIGQEISDRSSPRTLFAEM